MTDNPSARDPLVAVRVGNSKTPFHIHESLLCSSSQFFQIKKKPEWSRQGTTVDLSDQSEDVFNIYANWLYMNKIPTAIILSQSSEDNEKEWKILAEAYVMGEVLLDTSFRDTVIDALRAKVRSTSGHLIWSCGGELVKTVYDGTPENSAARRLLVDIYASHAGKQELAMIWNAAPKEFLYDVVVATRDNLSSGPLNNFSGAQACKYHIHGNNADCYLKDSGANADKNGENPFHDFLSAVPAIEQTIKPTRRVPTKFGGFGRALMGP